MSAAHYSMPVLLNTKVSDNGKSLDRIQPVSKQKSDPEKDRSFYYWSGREDLNLRPLATDAVTLAIKPRTGLAGARTGSPRESAPGGCRSAENR